MIVRCTCTTPFGSAVVPLVYAMSAGAIGSTATGASIAPCSSRSVNANVPAARAVADDRDPLEVVDVALGPDRVEVGEEVLVAEPVGGHERLHPGAPEDVADLLGAVEVHDRHDDRAEVRDRVERGRRLDPVRELERDRVAGPDAPGAQARRDPAREIVDLAERAAERAALRAHRERVIGNRAQTRSPGSGRASRRSRSRRARSSGHVGIRLARLPVERHLVSCPPGGDRA